MKTEIEIEYWNDPRHRERRGE